MVLLPCQRGIQVQEDAGHRGQGGAVRIGGFVWTCSEERSRGRGVRFESRGFALIERHEIHEIGRPWLTGRAEPVPTDDPVGRGDAALGGHAVRQRPRRFHEHGIVECRQGLEALLVSQRKSL